jgi:hypothetical protein
MIQASLLALLEQGRTRHNLRVFLLMLFISRRLRSYFHTLRDSRRRLRKATIVSLTKSQIMFISL